MDGIKIMKYFKDSTGRVFAYEADGSQDDYIGADQVPLTEDEISLLLNPNSNLTDEDRRAFMPPLTRRQFRLALVTNGYNLADIEALIDQIEDPMQRTIAQIEWQDATEFERTNPTLLKMAELMQITTAQVDQIWAFGLSL